MDTVSNLETALLFCENCHNLLYPESDASKTMKWKCPYCKRVESHNDKIVVHSVTLKREVGGMKEKELLAEFSTDPTAQRDPNKVCECGGNDVAAFVNPFEQPTEDMTLFFACPSCKRVWKDDPIKGAVSK